MQKEQQSTELENDSSEGLDAQRRFLREARIAFEVVARGFGRTDDAFAVLRSHDRRIVLAELEGLTRRTVDLVYLCVFGRGLNERKIVNKKKFIKRGLVTVASVVAAAGAIVMLPEAAVPAVVLAVAKPIVAWGTVAGIIAGALGIKGMDSLNTPKADKRGQVADAEDPR